MKSIKEIFSKRLYKSKIVVMALGVLVTLPFLPLVATALSNTSPTLTIVSPSNGSAVSGTVLVSVNAVGSSTPSTACVVTISGVSYDVASLRGPHPGGNIFVCGTDMTTTYQSQHGSNMSRMLPFIIPMTGISKVEFSVDGTLKLTDTTSPYSFSFNTTQVATGTHTVSAKAYDLAGNATTSSISIIVNNVSGQTGQTDTISPLISIVRPTEGSIQKNKMKVKVNATDNVSVKKVEIYIDGNLVKTDKHKAYSFSIKTKNLSNGIHTLVAKAYDRAGNIGISSQINFTVSHNVKINSQDNRKDKDDDRDHRSVKNRNFEVEDDD